MGVWQFIQDQVFGMKWLNELIGKGLSKLGLDVGERIGGSIQFFFYDVLKITVLLCLLIFVISYIQSYFPPERSKRILSRFHGVGANIISALLGTVTPFCSCSSIPLFIGFTSAGLPLGVTFSFLISSPMVDLGSLILLMSIFGAKVAVIYVIVGLMIAVAGGTLIEKLHMEPYVEEFVRAAGGVDIESPTLTKRERIQYAREQVISTFKKVFPYILVGVGIGAIIHNWIPESWIEADGWSTDAYMFIVTYPEKSAPADAKEYFIGYGSSLKRGTTSYFSSLAKLFIIQKEENRRMQLWIDGSTKVKAYIRSLQCPVSVSVNGESIPIVYDHSNLKIEL